MIKMGITNFKSILEADRNCDVSKYDLFLLAQDVCQFCWASIVSVLPSLYLWVPHSLTACNQGVQAKLSRRSPGNLSLLYLSQKNSGTKHGGNCWSFLWNLNVAGLPETEASVSVTYCRGDAAWQTATESSVAFRNKPQSHVWGQLGPGSAAMTCSHGWLLAHLGWLGLWHPALLHLSLTFQ